MDHNSLLLMLFAAGSAQGQAWTLDSGFSQTTNERIVSATLNAVVQIDSWQGPFTPQLVLACKVGRYRIPSFRELSTSLLLSVAPKVEPFRLDHPGYANVEVRFDSAPPEVIRAVGIEHAHGLLIDPIITRPAWRPGLETSRRLLLRFVLITGEEVAAAFRLPPNTRVAVATIRRACRDSP